MGKPLKQLKHGLARAIRKIKPSACCLKSDIALSFTSCYIGISATHLVLYFMYGMYGHALTITYIMPLLALVAMELCSIVPPPTGIIAYPVTFLAIY